MLTWSWATEDDADEFEQFSCSNGSTEPWVKEADFYVRYSVLHQAQYVLSHRDESGTLIAISAFDAIVVGIPVISPLDHPGWHIQVVAIADDNQNLGRSQEVFSGTFQAMGQLDSDRVFVTANVHAHHVMSNRACARAGLIPWVPLDDIYWILLGEVPEG